MPSQSIIDLKAPCQCLTPDPGHYFYGYYDNPAWSGEDSFHLCHRVNFWDRLPGPDDIATLGMIRLADKQFIPLTETAAWNFQQGSMLQWHPLAPDESIIFNRFVDGRFAAAVRDIKTGDERLLSRPLANVDPTGRHGLSINFSRMFDFRPGYGYANLPDPNVNVAQPENDGVWLVDLNSGKSELILSLKAIAAIDPAATAGRKILINHITFNTDGTRFVFLARLFPTPQTKSWTTAVYTADLQGNIYPLRSYAYASHYHWRDPKHIVFHNETSAGVGLQVLTDLSQEQHMIDPAFFLRDGHCIYSPDRRWLMYDSYQLEGYRFLYLYDLTKHQGITLGRFRCGAHDQGDIRTDLHPRWNRSGMAISFDSTHEDRRAVYSMDLSGFVRP